MLVYLRRSPLFASPGVLQCYWVARAMPLVEYAYRVLGELCGGAQALGYK